MYYNSPMKIICHFEYHKLLYGYEVHEIIGFGAGAISLVDGYNFANIQDINQYIASDPTQGAYISNIYSYDQSYLSDKGLSLHLPYH